MPFSVLTKKVAFGTKLLEVEFYLYSLLLGLTFLLLISSHYHCFL